MRKLLLAAMAISLFLTANSQGIKKDRAKKSQSNVGQAATAEYAAANSVKCQKVRVGLNQNWSYFPSFDNKAMLSQICSMKPDMIRYPGGTVAHSWDWRKGVITSRKPKQSHPISDLKRLVDATGVKVVFVLDIANQTIDDQLKMLKSSREQGIPVDYIELGNELYAQDKVYEAKFPTGVDYAKKANEWIPKIKEEFPNAKVAILLLARSVRPSNSRMYEWNSLVTTTITPAIDAYTYHVYISDKGDFQSTKANFERIVKLANTGSKELWITEYGNQHPKSDANYLGDLEKLADFIEAYPKVTIALSHQIVGNDKNKLTADGNQLTPEGQLYVKRADQRKKR